MINMTKDIILFIIIMIYGHCKQNYYKAIIIIKSYNRFYVGIKYYCSKTVLMYNANIFGLSSYKFI